MKRGVWNGLPHCRVRGFVGAGDKQTLSSRYQTFGDRGYLIRGLAGPVHHLWSAGANRAVMVDARKPEIFEWSPAEETHQLILSLVDTERAVLDTLQKVAYLLLIHSREWRASVRLDRVV